MHEIITALAARFFRCFETGFFDFPHDSRLAFRRDCALATYGDDMLAAPVRGKFGFTESTWA